MERRTVDLRVGGQSYRVVSSAPAEELQRLARVVSDKLAEVSPKGRPVQPQAMLLAAMALAHQLEEERLERASIEQRTREVLRKTLGRIDDLVQVK